MARWWPAGPSLAIKHVSAEPYSGLTRRSRYRPSVTCWEPYGLARNDIGRLSVMPFGPGRLASVCGEPLLYSADLSVDLFPVGCLVTTYSAAILLLQ